MTKKILFFVRAVDTIKPETRAEMTSIETFRNNEKFHQKFPHF